MAPLEPSAGPIRLPNPIELVNEAQRRCHDIVRGVQRALDAAWQQHCGGAASPSPSSPSSPPRPHISWPFFNPQNNANSNPNSNSFLPAFASSSSAAAPAPLPSSYAAPAGPPTREDVGRATWIFLHALAAQYPPAPTRRQRRDASSLIDILTRMYPCGECARHFREIVGSHPPQVGSHDEFQQWMCRVHNVVNRSLGKPAFNCRAVAARWGALECGGDDGDACALDGSWGGKSDTALTAAQKSAQDAWWRTDD